MTARPSSQADQRVADAARDNWVDRYAPPSARPYLRLTRADRPIGAWLLLLPGWQALALAAASVRWDGLDPLWGVWLFAAFFIGAFVMRGAGCVLNDIIDRDIDAQVARTRSRPLPSGQVTLKAAIALLAALCLGGLAVLLTFNWTAVAVGVASALPVAVYPFMKRVTWWPQLFLGFAFNWGALVAWAAVTGGLSPIVGLLYLGGIFWTIGYDTIYAHQDREDDALIGVKSTARLFGDRTRLALILFYGLAVLCAAAAALLAGLGPWFWLGLLAYAAHLAAQIWRLDINDPAGCLHLFKSNREAGLLLLAAIAMGGL